MTITLASLKTNSITLQFTNTNSFDVYIDQLVVWGKPARVVDEVRYEAYDQDSVDKYGEQVLEVDNNFIGTIDGADALAVYIIHGYKDFASVVTMEVKGDPSLQLGDVITITAENFNDTYKVINIKDRLDKYQYRQTITARRYNIENWFQLDVSVLDGTDYLAP